MVNETIHIKESELTPQEKNSIGLEEKPQMEMKKKESFFSRLRSAVKKHSCVICGSKTASKTGFCAECRRKHPQQVKLGKQIGSKLRKL